jgi:mycoredoxin
MEHPGRCGLEGNAKLIMGMGPMGNRGKFHAAAVHERTVHGFGFFSGKASGRGLSSIARRGICCGHGPNLEGLSLRLLRVGRHLHRKMEIVVYSAFWCPDCREAKRFLRRHNLAFKEIDIEATPGAAEEVVRRAGKRAIPQFVIDGEWIQPYRPGEGFLYHEMARRLGVKEP